jgi:hypothetical protein
MSEEQSILTYLASTAEVIDDTFPWSESAGLDHKKVVGTVKSLMADGYLLSEDLSFSFYTLTDQGTAVVASGSQEFQVYTAIKVAGKMSMSDLQTKVGKDVSKVGMANCMKNRWIKKDGADLVPIADAVEDIVKGQLSTLQEASGNPDTLDEKVRKTVFLYRGFAYSACPKQGARSFFNPADLLDTASKRNSCLPLSNSTQLSAPNRSLRS